MRALSKGNDIVLDMLPVTNSDKSMYESVWLGDANYTLGGLTASDVASRIADGESTEGDGLMNYSAYKQGNYSRNIASLSGEVLIDPSALVGSSSGGDSGFNQPILRDRTALFTSNWYNSPVVVKPECALKYVVSSSLVRFHFFSLSDIGNVIYSGKISTGQHLQTYVAPIAPSLATCGVRSRSTKAKGFVESTVYIITPPVRDKVTVYLTPVLHISSVSSSIVHSLLQLECTVSF